MRINIENFVRMSCKRGQTSVVFGHLVEHMKELRRRTLAGDMSALNEFFELYRFSDNQCDEYGYRPIPAEEPLAPTQSPVGTQSVEIDGTIFIYEPKGAQVQIVREGQKVSPLPIDHLSFFLGHLEEEYPLPE